MAVRAFAVAGELWQTQKETVARIRRLIYNCREDATTEEQEGDCRMERSIRGMSGTLPAPEDLPALEGLPALMTFRDGSPVGTPEDWQRRRAELLALYGRYVYGFMPDLAGERVSYRLTRPRELPGTPLTVTVEAGGRQAELAAGSHNNLLIHLDGHAILPSDMAVILDYCDLHLLGKGAGAAGMDGALFLEDNRAVLDPLFGL